MISKDDALKLLQKYKLPEARIIHSLGVAEKAYNIALRIHQIHPEIILDPQKVMIAAILHDIGRSMPGDHELNTIRILCSEGHEDIASITMHGSYYEVMLLRGIDNPQFIPQTVENKIVAYADARYKDHSVSMEERWAEIEHRRKNDLEKTKSIQMAKPRFIQMEKELEELLNESTDL